MTELLNSEERDLYYELDFVIKRKNFEKLDYAIELENYINNKTAINVVIGIILKENSRIITDAIKEIKLRTNFIENFIEKQRFVWEEWQIEKYTKEIEFQDIETLKSNIQTEIAQLNINFKNTFGYNIISFFNGLDFTASKESINAYFWHSECFAGSPRYFNDLYSGLVALCDKMNQLKVLSSTNIKSKKGLRNFSLIFGDEIDAEVWEIMFSLKMIDNFGQWLMGSNRYYLFGFIRAMKRNNKITNMPDKQLVRLFTLKLFQKEYRINKSFKSEDAEKEIEAYLLNK